MTDDLFEQMMYFRIQCRAAWKMWRQYCQNMRLIHTRNELDEIFRTQDTIKRQQRSHLREWRNQLQTVVVKKRMIKKIIDLSYR